MSAHNAAPTQRDLTDWLMLAALVVLWGSAFALMKIAVESISPIWIAALRLIIGASIVLAVLALRGERLPLDREAVMGYVIIGLTGTFFPYILLPWGQQFIDTGLTGILMALTPLAVMTTAHLLLPDERLTRFKLIGLGVGLIGMAVLFAPKLTGALPSTGVEIAGMAAILACAVLFAIQAVMARRMPRRIGSMQKAAGSLLVASLATAVTLPLTDPVLPSPTLPSLLAVVALGVITTALTAFVYFRLVDRAGPGFVSLSNYLIPLFSVALGFVAFAERLPPEAFAALFFVLAGIAVSERRR